MHINNPESTMDGLLSELRRGTLVLCVLSQLKEKQYGYSLSQSLAEKGMEVEQGTLYPLLRRLEKQELLDSDWVLEEARPRRYYVLSSKGRAMLADLGREWDDMVKVLDNMLGRNGEAQ
jgi:PadR family transcriptional regulator, regulatory protein PadR